MEINILHSLVTAAVKHQCLVQLSHHSGWQSASCHGPSGYEGVNSEALVTATLHGDRHDADHQVPGTSVEGMTGAEATGDTLVPVRIHRR